MSQIPPPTTPSPNNRRRRGCCGCLAAVVLLGCGFIALLAAGPTLLEAMGFFGPSAEELYAGAPDRAASTALETALAAQSVAGVDVLVLPITGQEGQVAVVTIPQDATAGGIQTREEAERFLKETMAALVAANRSGNHGVEQIAVNLADDNGVPLITIAAGEEVVAAYAAGEISQAEFLQSVGVDYSNLIAALQAEGLWEGQQ